jgi:hypothetical protein
MEIENIFFAIKKVKDIYFSINEQYYVPDPNKIVRIELGERIGFNLEFNLVNFILRIFFHYVDEPDILVDFHVENIFEVANLKQFENKNEVVILPPKLITSIVGLSLSHGRALLLKNTSGTRWQDIILPVTNPEDAAKYFYPYMFNEESIVLKSNKEGNPKSNPVVISKEEK